MIKRYKIIAGGYNKGTFNEKSSALQEANNISYHYDKVIVRPVKGNGCPFPMADDIIVSKGVITFRPKLLIGNINIAA